mgnify:FL=1
MRPFRYRHCDDGARIALRYKGRGEDRDATDHDRCIIEVVAIEGTRSQVEAFLEHEDLLYWAEWADRALREDLRLPERGAEWDGNALTAPPPLSVEFAEPLRVVMS